jgi:hypothetical protein
MAVNRIRDSNSDAGMISPEPISGKPQAKTSELEGRVKQLVAKFQEMIDSMQQKPPVSELNGRGHQRIESDFILHDFGHEEVALEKCGPRKIVMNEVPEHMGHEPQNVTVMDIEPAKSLASEHANAYQKISSERRSVVIPEPQFAYEETLEEDGTSDPAEVHGESEETKPGNAEGAKPEVPQNEESSESDTTTS